MGEEGRARHFGLRRHVHFGKVRPHSRLGTATCKVQDDKPNGVPNGRKFHSQVHQSSFVSGLKEDVGFGRKKSW